jgi:outer membrane protein assembly factor BamE (lipoprotein component of BamABCDE complex)
MKSILCSCLAVIALAFVTGCAGTINESKFTADTIGQIKTGMTKDEVTAIVGEPRSRSVDDDGDETWQYRKNAQQGQAAKSFANIMSFGLNSGIDSEYQDILTVMFKTNVVSKVTYQENVQSPNPFGTHN